MNTTIVRQVSLSQSQSKEIDYEKRYGLNLNIVSKKEFYKELKTRKDMTLCFFYSKDKIEEPTASKEIGLHYAQISYEVKQYGQTSRIFIHLPIDGRFEKYNQAHTTTIDSAFSSQNYHACHAKPAFIKLLNDKTDIYLRWLYSNDSDNYRENDLHNDECRVVLQREDRRQNIANISEDTYETYTCSGQKGRMIRTTDNPS